MSGDTQVIETRPVGQHWQGIPESPGVDARHLVWLGAAALLLLSGAIFGLGALYWHDVPIMTMPPLETFPAPRVQTDEAGELQQTLERQRQELSGYRWANQQHTLVQIPIERAMKFIARKGAHGYDPVAAIPGALASPEAGAERLTTPSATPPTAQSIAPAAPPPNHQSSAPSSDPKPENTP